MHRQILQILFSRRRSTAIAAAIVAAGMVAGGAGGLHAQAADASSAQHGVRASKGAVRTEDLSPEQKIRMERLFARVMCNCPVENWSKTLAGCPDGCSLPQKREIRALIKAGKSDEEILAAQLAENGPKVLARPGAAGLSGFTLYVLPFLVVAALTAIVVAVLRRLVRGVPRAEPRTGAAGPADPVPGAASGNDEEDRMIAARIDRELEEMD